MYVESRSMGKFELRDAFFKRWSDVLCYTPISMMNLLTTLSPKQFF